MQSTYEQAITQVFQDEGGYTNDPHDPGGPTNWGITIHDARQYWKSDATAYDVRQMDKSVAEDIYRKHYANPIHYDDLPAGIDYALLDYGINSGISRSVKELQQIVGVHQDGVLGPITLNALQLLLEAPGHSVVGVINRIYDDRESFLKSLSTWKNFGHGWFNRCANGRALALKMAQSKGN